SSCSGSIRERSVMHNELRWWTIKVPQVTNRWNPTRAAKFVNLVDKFVVALAGALLCASAALVRAEPAPDDFFIYVANDRVDEVKKMLAQGVDPDAVDKNGEPAIVLAARGGNTKTLDVLLATKVNVNARNSFGDSAIMAAAIGGRLDLVKKLRARGADVNNKG